jgi:hypothetical protein
MNPIRKIVAVLGFAAAAALIAVPSAGRIPATAQAGGSTAAGVCPASMTWDSATDSCN